MKELDFIDDITMSLGNFDSLLKLFEMITFKLSNDTLNSSERDKIINCINLFNVIFQAMTRESEILQQKCDNFSTLLQGC